MNRQKEIVTTGERKISRRSFVKKSAAISAFTIVPSYVLGGAGNIAPSEKLNIACIGIGGMGKANLKNCSDAGQNIVALCDVDSEFAAPVFDTYPKAKRYKDYRIMLEKDRDIEAVIIATPDHIHAIAAMAAMKAGKHVYVQKPMTYTVEEARLLTKTAKEMKIASQMGNQGQSGEQIRLQAEWIRAGAIGTVREVHLWTNRPGGPNGWPQGIGRPQGTPNIPETLDWDLWLGPATERPYNPAYHPFKWRAWRDFGTGPLGDMGCHIFNHPIFALDLGHPTSVEACTTALLHSKDANRETYPMASMVTYHFPAKGDRAELKMVWYDGGLKPPRAEGLEQGRQMPDDSAILYIGDKGAMLQGRLLPASRMKEFVRPPKTLKRINGTHEQNWIEACKGGPAASSNFDFAGFVTEIVLLGAVAQRIEAKLYWNPENMKTNNENANKLLTREYRNGWKL